MLTSLILTVLLAQAAAPAAPVTVIFETELGTITMEIDVAHAPVSAANFLKYVDGKFYDGGMINRSVRPDNTIRHDVEIQVIQFQSNPARRDMFPAIPLERTSVTGLKHLNGVLSMARSTAADSATSSFSIMIGDQPSLDFGGARNPDGQGFAAFGKVVAGMDVVKKIQASHTSETGTGGYRTETLDPPIKIISAHRK